MGEREIVELLNFLLVRLILFGTHLFVHQNLVCLHECLLLQYFINSQISLVFQDFFLSLAQKFIVEFSCFEVVIHLGIFFAFYLLLKPSDKIFIFRIVKNYAFTGSPTHTPVDEGL